MPIFATLFLGVFTSAIGFVSRWLVMRYAVAVAGVAAAAAQWAVMFAAIRGILGTLSLVCPASLVNALQLFKPTAFESTLSLYFTGLIAIAAFRWYRQEQSSTNKWIQQGL